MAWWAPRPGRCAVILDRFVAERWPATLCVVEDSGAIPNVTGQWINVANDQLTKSCRYQVCTGSLSRTLQSARAQARTAGMAPSHDSTGCLIGPIIRVNQIEDDIRRRSGLVLYNMSANIGGIKTAAELHRSNPRITAKRRNLEFSWIHKVSYIVKFVVMISEFAVADHNDQFLDIFRRFVAA